MIDPEAGLFIYEIKNELPAPLPDAPKSLVGVWNEEDFSYVFFIEPEDHYVAKLCSSLGMTVSSRHDMRYCDWQEGLPKGGLNICGMRFVPDYGVRGDSNSIILDPSVVFGDGNHPTTRTCVEFMVEVINTGRVKSAVDLGSGSGILSLVAARLGLEKVVAVDRNLLAVQSTRKNVSLNGMEGIIKTYEGEARIFMDDRYDLVLANLPFTVLRDLVVLKEAAKNKMWIVSGINLEQSLVLKTLFNEQGFLITRERVNPPWVTLIAAEKFFWSELFDEI
ncbi:MAG: 50S ribosomal protein L11 methyltransferase [Pseudomonadota bacterium]